MELTWLEKAEVRGMERTLEQLKGAVLRRIVQRFGLVPERVQKTIEATDSVDSLTEMVERLPTLTSVEDLATGDSR